VRGAEQRTVAAETADDLQAERFSAQRRLFRGPGFLAGAVVAGCSDGVDRGIDALDASLEEFDRRNFL